ncbi:MAG: hypothetical protein KIS78_13590 [Labilithrix sp.]|nr:hypothetical protein [Labilithrix sp.]
MLPFISNRRRLLRRLSLSRSLSALAAPFLIVVAAEDAEAIPLGTPAQERPFRSAQHFALEVRVSPYFPAVDEEPGLRGTPFRDRFGDAPRVAIGLELDWQTLRVPFVGTLGPGLGAGVVSMSRQAVTLSGRPSGDEYGLTIYPLYLAAVLRGDALWRELGVPFVPFTKIGVGAGVWRAWDTGGTSRSPDGTRGRSITWGTLLAVGASLPLDAIDPTASRSMDSAVGINATHLFVEYYWLALDGLLQRDALHVGTKTWAGGLAVEF